MVTKTREPWEMTREEYGNSLIKEGQRKQQLAEKYKYDAPKGIYLYSSQGRKINDEAAYTISQGLAIKTETYGTSGARFGNPHKLDVQQALSEGKPVPPEVLKGYPDLAPVTPEVAKLTGEIWDTMTPIERDNLRVRAKANVNLSQEGAKLEVSKYWGEYWGQEKRALIREYKKMQTTPKPAVKPTIIRSPVARLPNRKLPRITPKRPRLK